MAEFAISRLDPKPTNAAIVYADNPAGPGGIRLAAQAGVRRRRHPGHRGRGDRSGRDGRRHPGGHDRRRRRYRRRVHLGRHRAELHRHVRRDPTARHRPGGRHDRLVLRHRHDRSSRRASAKTGRCPTGGTSAATATATSCPTSSPAWPPTSTRSSSTPRSRRCHDRVHRLRRAELRQHHDHRQVRQRTRRRGRHPVDDREDLRLRRSGHDPGRNAQLRHAPPCSG